MKLWAGRFLKNRRGAFAMQFALMALPLCVCTGLAIDGGRAFLARFELASALDAAALAVGSSTETDVDELEALAAAFVERNFRAARIGDIELELTPGADVITLAGDVTIGTYFMPLVGQPYVTVSAESEVRRGGNSVEVALALDITGSMAGSRIAALKVAASDLIEEVVNDVQEPFYSRVAIVPWASNVYLGDLADEIRGTPTAATTITAATWRDGTAKNVTAATWKNGATKSIGGVTRASQAVVTSTAHGFANNDYIYITNVNGMTQLNNLRYRVSDVATNTFKIRNADTGAYINSSGYSNYSSNGTIQKCFTQTCEVRVTSSSHGFANGDFVRVTGVNGMTQINNPAAAPWTWEVKNQATNTFILKNTTGPSYTDYTSSGSAQKCFTSICEVRVTSDAHGLANNDYVQITGVAGMTQINNSATSSWRVSNVAASTYVLQTSTGPTYSNYTSAGASQCLKYGCVRQRWTNNSGTVRYNDVGLCAVERLGAQAYTDAAPDTNPLGMNYPIGTQGVCEDESPVTPLTSDEDLLLQRIDDMVLAGSTAGQIGAAWSWYMLSPDWGYLWPAEENRPAAYGSDDLVKVAVLMTDGEFNTAHCNGFQSKNYAINGNAEKINCNATNGAPFTQAETICENMRDEGVIIYTVGFELAAGGSAEDFMVECAGDASRAYLTANAEELQAAFQDIAAAITKLRIAR